MPKPEKISSDQIKSASSLSRVPSNPPPLPQVAPKSAPEAVQQLSPSVDRPPLRVSPFLDGGVDGETDALNGFGDEDVSDEGKKEEEEEEGVNDNDDKIDNNNDSDDDNKNEEIEDRDDGGGGVDDDNFPPRRRLSKTIEVKPFLSSRGRNSITSITMDDPTDINPFETFDDSESYDEENSTRQVKVLQSTPSSSSIIDSSSGGLLGPIVSDIVPLVGTSSSSSSGDPGT